MKGKGFGGNVLRLVSCAAVVGGLVVLAWPVASEYVASERAAAAISRIESVYDGMDDEARRENAAQAHAYNDRLAGRTCDGDVWDYDAQLTYQGEPSTMMAWVQIPKIGSSLPVYHHTTEAVLMAGVGHVDTTALPVGGEGTLCALSGHSGMRNARMFDDIRELDTGDTFVVWTLKEPYAYKVCDVRTVAPDDTSALEPCAGEDLCALITCTPLNVNTHRLVVTGRRCEYVAAARTPTADVRRVANRRTAPLLAGGCLIAATASFVLVRRRCRHV